MDTRSNLKSRPRRWILNIAAPLALAALSASTSLLPAARAQGAPATAPAAAAAPAGEAIRLRSKWTPGEVLSYTMQLDGTINTQASPNAGNPFAGIPLDVVVKMSGASALEALSVDEAGTARVVPRLNAFRMQATTFGQRADLSLQDGRFAFAFNGQQMGRGDRNDRNGAFLTNPPFALEISSLGRITGAVPRDEAGRVREPGAADANADPKPGAAGVPGLDWAKLAQSMIWRAVPTLWPTMPVKAGDTWKSDVTIPLPDPATVADAAANKTAPALIPQQLGHFDFTMRGLEDVAGQKAARIGVQGGIEIDGKLSRSLADLGRSESARVAPESTRQVEGAVKDAQAKRRTEFDTQLTKAAQRVEGDLWVDPATGHIVRAELNLDTQTSANDVPRAGVTPRGKAGNSFFDFSGTLQMQLTNRTVKPAA